MKLSQRVAARVRADEFCRNLSEAVEENSPSIRHQNLAVFELFSGLSVAEKPDEERVLEV